MDLHLTMAREHYKLCTFSCSPSSFDVYWILQMLPKTEKMTRWQGTFRYFCIYSLMSVHLLRWLSFFRTLCLIEVCALISREKIHTVFYPENAVKLNYCNDCKWGHFTLNASIQTTLWLHVVQITLSPGRQKWTVILIVSMKSDYPVLVIYKIH